MIDIQIVYDKRDEFNFPIVSFPFVRSKIPVELLGFGVYIFQLIRYFSIYASHLYFLDRRLLQTSKLITQGFMTVRLKSSIRANFDGHHELIDGYLNRIYLTDDSVSSCTVVFSFRPIYYVFLYWTSFITLNNTMGVACEAGILLILPAHMSSPRYWTFSDQ